MPLIPLLLATALSRPDVVRANIDFSVKPGVDIFDYANGAWLKKHPIPASESSWGVGKEVNEELYKQLRQISEQSAKRSSKPGTDDQKVGSFWKTAMDEAKAERVGLTPLRPDLDRIEAISNTQDALDTAFILQREGVESFFGFAVYQDEKSSDTMAVHLGQGGLGLPDRDFYFNPEAGVAKIRTAYLTHLENLLKMASSADPKAGAANVMAFETAMAKFSRKLEDLRDPEHNYNKMPTAEVTAKFTPSIDWATRLTGWKLKPRTIIVGQPEFFSGLEKLLADTPTETLKDYLRAHLVNRYSSFLNKEADKEDFYFNHQVLSGQRQPRPRWKRVIDSENDAIGFVLGHVFVKAYFPAAAKGRYENLVEAFRGAYGERIDKLDWMSPKTKTKAHQKLAAITKKVGYPNKWKDYSALTIGTKSYCDNMMAASRWAFDDMVSKFGKPVDRTEWTMTPQTYNAYYNPSNNEIVLPAAMFTIPGFKDADVDDAVVYGYAGASTIGHEMTHGFDDEGRQFDAKGNLADWWTKEDAKKFQARAALMVKQFNAYKPIPGLHINGSASLGENIADYGGLLLGIDAFKKTKQYKQGKKIDGLTPMQRYFLGYALSWMSQYRDQVTRRILLSDVHSPAKWRVIGPFSNIPDFYKAFDVKPGQPMWRAPSDRVHIW